MYRGFVGTFFSHFLSLLSSFWAIASLSDSSFLYDEIIWIRYSFLLVAINSCLGLVRYGNSTFGYKLRKLHILTLNLSTVVCFSIRESVLHYTIKSPRFLVYSPFLNAIPFVYNLLQRDYRTKVTLPDTFIAVNSIIACAMSYSNENYFGVALILSYLFGYFIIGECGFLFDTELPSIDAYQYLTCFLNAFTVYAFSY